MKPRRRGVCCGVIREREYRAETVEPGVCPCVYHVKLLEAAGSSAFCPVKAYEESRRILYPRANSASRKSGRIRLVLKASSSEAGEAADAAEGLDARAQERALLQKLP